MTTAATIVRKIQRLYTTDAFDAAFSLSELQELGTPALRAIYAAARSRALELDQEMSRQMFAELTTGDNVTQLVPRRNHPAAMTRAALYVVESLTVSRSVQISEETIEWGGFLGGHTVNRHNHSEVIDCILAAYH